MDKWGMETIVEGELWDIMKKGIVFPLNDEDVDEPELTMAKVEVYETGKKLFLRSIEVMAMTVLPKLSIDAKGLEVSLIVEEK